MTARKMTKSQRMAKDRLSYLMWKASEEESLELGIEEDVPEEWHGIIEDLDVAEKKVKITLLLDQSVAKFFRGMGQGYQARINRILATWAQMKIADAFDDHTFILRRLNMSLEATLQEKTAASEARNAAKAARRIKSKIGK